MHSKVFSYCSGMSAEQSAEESQEELPDTTDGSGAAAEQKRPIMLERNS